MNSIEYLVKEKQKTEASLGSRRNTGSVKGLMVCMKLFSYLFSFVVFLFLNVVDEDIEISRIIIFYALDFCL